jgi:hypothetical protein
MTDAQIDAYVFNVGLIHDPELAAFIKQPRWRRGSQVIIRIDATRSPWLPWGTTDPRLLAAFRKLLPVPLELREGR